MISLLKNIKYFEKFGDNYIGILGELPKEIMLKHRKIANEKADELKNLLIKNAIASEVFDREAALKNIKSMLNW